MKYDAEQDMNEYREEDIKNNKIRKSVEARVTRVTVKIWNTYWEEFNDVTETKAIKYVKESFLDELPWGWEVEDIEVETIVHDDGY